MSYGQFLELLISLTLQVAGVVLVTDWLCQRTTHESTRCSLWGTAYLLVLFLTGVAINFPHLRLVHPWVPVPAEVVIYFAGLFEQVGMVLLVVWLLGLLVSMTVIVTGTFNTTRFVRTCLCVTGPLNGLAKELAADGIIAGGQRTGAIRLLWHPVLTSPFCWQLHQPHIVLPEFMLRHDEEDVRLVVRHELEHLRLGHPMQLLVQRVVDALFWFHPLVWRASRRIALSREFLCDDAAVSEGSDTVPYLKLLIAMVESGQLRRSVPNEVLTFGKRAPEIAIRIRRLVSQASQPVLVTGGRHVRWPYVALTCLAVAISQVWLPLYVLASPRSIWSPWPRWTADTLHDFGIHVRDYETSVRETSIHELSEDHVRRPFDTPNTANY